MRNLYNINIYESKFLNLIEKNILKIMVITISILALLIRIQNYKYTTWDYLNCLEPWVNQMKNLGGLHSLKYKIIDYPEGYALFLSLVSYSNIRALYFIKTLSVLCDYGIAICSAFIVKEVYLGKQNIKLLQSIVYVLILMAPTIIINSSFWGQNDSVFSFFIILSIFFAIKEKYRNMFIAYTIAISIKQTALLFFPIFFLFYFVKKKFSIINFIWIIITYFIICLPAIISGKNIKT